MKRIPTNLRLMLAALFAVCLGVSAWAGFASMSSASASYPESASATPAQAAAPAPAKVKAAAPSTDFTASGNYRLFWTENEAISSSPAFSSNTDQPWGFYRYNVADGTYEKFANFDATSGKAKAENGDTWWTNDEYCFVSVNGNSHASTSASPAIVFTAPQDGIYYATFTARRNSPNNYIFFLRSRLVEPTAMQCDKGESMFAKAYGTDIVDGVDGKQPQTLDFYVRLSAGQRITFEEDAYSRGHDDSGRTFITDLSVVSLNAEGQPFTYEEAQAYPRFYDATAVKPTVDLDANGNYHLFKADAPDGIGTADASFSNNDDAPWGYYRHEREAGTYTKFTTFDTNNSNAKAENGNAWYTNAEYCFVTEKGNIHPTNSASPAIKFTAPATGIYYGTMTVWRDKEKQYDKGLVMRSCYIGENVQTVAEKVYGTISDLANGKKPETFDFFIKVKQGDTFTFEIGDAQSGARTHISDLGVATCHADGSPFTLDEAKAYPRFYDAVGEEQSASSTVVMEYTAGTTTNMLANGSNEAATVNLNASEWSVVADKGANNNSPGLNKAKDIRLYWSADGGNTITVSSLSGATIESIAITFTGDSYKNVSVTVNGQAVSGTNGVYPINATSFVLGNANTSNVQVRMTKVEITYTAGGSTPPPVVTVTPPVIQPETGTYFGTKEVSITADQGCDIWYSINGGQDQQYTAPFEVSETSTIVAYAKDNAGNESAKVTNTLTFGPSYTSCAAANAAATGTKVDVCVTLTDALVTYVVPDPSNKACAYVEDATGGFLIYGSHKFNVGDKFTGSIEGQLYTYHGLPEIVPTGYTNLSITSSDNPVAPAEVDAAELADNPLTYVSRYVVVKPATFAASQFDSNNNVNFTVGETTLVLRDNFSKAPTFDTEKNFSVAGLITIYNTNTQLYPTKAEDVAEMAAAPALGYGDISTAALANPSFELSSENTPLTADLKASNAALNIYGWTEGGVGNQFNNTEVITASSTSSSAFGVATPSDGSYDLFFRQGWNSNTNPSIVTLTAQTLTVLPAGTYQLLVDYKQSHSANNDHPSGNTTVAIAMQSTEATLGTATSAAAPAGNGTYFASSEWSTLTADVILSAEAQPDVVITLTAAGGIRSDFFIDNVRLIRISEADLARAELKEAIEPAEATVTAAANVGDGLFQYAPSTYNTFAQAVADAKAVADNINATADQLHAAKDALGQAILAYTVTAPDPDQAYNIQIKEGGTFMTLDDGTKQASDPTELFFEAIEGGWAITDGQGNYVAQAGSNPWNMNASTTPFAWTISSVADGEYTIAQASAPTKFIGIDNPATAGNKCYANKGASDNIVWLISQAAPHFQATAVDVNITREVGQGATAQTEAIDFAAAKAYLGVDELKPYMISIIDPDGVVQFDYAQFGGWFDATGKATSETDLGNNPGICLNFPEALTNGTFSVSDKNGADVVGQTYTVKWEFQANSRGYIYRFHITFVESTQPQTGDGADLVAENAAAAAAVTEGHYYRIFTQNEAGAKFYMTNEGYLTADEAEAALLPMTFISRTGSSAPDVNGTQIDVTAFKFDAKFTNPNTGGSATGAIVPQGHIVISDQNRADYESQVFFLGAESGKYAVRCTAAYSVKEGVANRWGSTAFWTTTDTDSNGLPEAEYGLEATYIWQLEDANEAVASFIDDVAHYTIKNADADVYMNLNTSDGFVRLSAEAVELSFEPANSSWYITDGTNYIGLSGGWNMSTASDNKAPVSINPISLSNNQMKVTISEEKGFVGCDNLTADQKCYSNKKVTDHGYWILTKVEPLPEVAIYSKVTSAEGLVPGAKYLMVNEEASVALGAISTTNTKYGLPVDVTIANSRITINDEAVDVLTLGASGSNWTFASSLDEGYLNWTSGNSLTLSTEAEANAQWTITFDADGNATIANVGTTARILSYNAGSPRFATYGNMNQKRVQLYKAGKPASGYGTDFVFNDEGIQSFGLAGNKNITPEDNTDNVINVTKNDIKDGIVVKYDNVDIEGVETHLSGFCASAKVTDQKGNTFLVKTKGNDNNVIYVAKGLFGPNEQYEVTIQPIVYYNYDQFCDGIYELWESEKENHKVMEADGKSWHLDPAWTLSAAAQQWSQNLKASGSIAYNGDVVNFDYCDPLPYYVDNTPHKFIIKTDNTVTSNVKALGTQEFKAFDVWGNDITAEYLSALEGGTATAIDGIEGSQDADGRIYNMAGQRVAKTTKGLYIVNGKKVAVK